MKKTSQRSDPNASQLITDMIADLSDWRGKVLARLRKMILDAAPDLSEEWKWSTAVWTSNGLVCSAGAFRDHVKLNFFKGASLKDPKRLFTVNKGHLEQGASDVGVFRTTHLGLDTPGAGVDAGRLRELGRRRRVPTARWAIPRGHPCPAQGECALDDRALGCPGGRILSWLR
jgi:hypothetical protein